MAVKTEVKFRSCTPYMTFRTSSRIWKHNDVHNIPIEEAKQLTDTYPEMFEFVKSLTPYQKAELEKKEKAALKKIEDDEKASKAELDKKRNNADQ